MLFLAYLVFYLLLILGDYALCLGIPYVAAHAGEGGYIVVWVYCVVNVVLILYFLVSRRVKSTFVR